MNNTFCKNCHRIPSQCCCVPTKTLTDDAIRYQWLRNEYAHGRETYLAEGMPSGEKLDEYIDEQLRKAQEK
jgi:hypothetical protein